VTRSGLRLLFLSVVNMFDVHGCTYSLEQGFPTWGARPAGGDPRGLISVISWVHLYQWGDADTKRLGTPGLEGI
jgi:hypothetical protein